MLNGDHSTGTILTMAASCRTQGAAAISVAAAAIGLFQVQLEHISMSMPPSAALRPL